MAEAAAHLVDHAIPKVPVRQWVLSFPTPLRSLYAVHPELLAPISQIIHLAASEEPAAFARILTHLRLTAQPPLRTPAGRLDLFQAA